MCFLQCISSCYSVADVYSTECQSVCDSVPRCIALSVSPCLTVFHAVAGIVVLVRKSEKLC